MPHTPHRSIRTTRRVPSGMRRPLAARLRATALAVAVTVAAGITGCTSFQPVPATTIPQDREVRVTLTDLAAATLAPALGGGVVAVDGVVRTRDDAGLVVAAAATVQRGGETQDWKGEPVRLRWSDVARIEVRRADRGRTALAALGIVGGALAMAAAMGTDFSLSGRSRGGDRPQQ